MRFKDWLSREDVDILGIYPPQYDAIGNYPPGYFNPSNVWINASQKEHKKKKRKKKKKS